MIRFNSDYTEGCHTAILEKLVETNMEQTAGYGEDEYCEQARELIRKACGMRVWMCIFLWAAHRRMSL